MAMSVQSNSGGRRRPMAEINITPFTDVCLVLLIIFMVSASFMNAQRGLDIKLPSPSKDAQKDNRPVRDITLLVASAGTITMTVTTGKSAAVSKVLQPDQLMAALDQEANQYHVQSVTIKADHGVVYKSVVSVMDTVKQAGIEYMALAVQAPAGRPAPKANRT
ncbi:MAG TPA: biopolymer transporter ExbD [Armatimonadota bacterium]|nr:biopolymer transporter ExbD [Armatimonadota bacterium]